MRLIIMRLILVKNESSDFWVSVPLIVNTNAVDQYSVYYNWDFGDGFKYLKANPASHKYMAKGDYKIKLNRCSHDSI